MKWHELEVHYTETSEAESKNKIECPISNSNDRKRAATRNRTKYTATSPEIMNEYSESDPDIKD